MITLREVAKKFNMNVTQFFENKIDGISSSGLNHLKKTNPKKYELLILGLIAKEKGLTPKSLLDSEITREITKINEKSH